LALLFGFSVSAPSLVSCGGTAFKGDPGSGGSNGSGANGSGATGATGASAGNGSGAGSSSGGSSSGTGGSGAGGSGGALPDKCLLVQESGPCDAAIPAYFHNSETGTCEPFTYGGCEGNDNRFDTLEECQSACNGGDPNFDVCSSPSDCMLVSPGCCGACEPIEAGSLVAINIGYADAYSSAKGCSGVSCGACFDPGPAQYTSQYFVATCVRHECTVVDIRQHEVTECDGPSDCVLRVGANCCEGCSGDGIVAINPDADLSSLVCGGELIGCPACAPQIDPAYASGCVEGRCVVHPPACTLENPCPL
jgi:hypothetical protein